MSRNKKFGGINIENKDVIPFTYDSLINANYHGETLYIVKNNKWGVIDKENKTIIKPIYEKIDLVGSLFRVKQVGGKAYGLYDKSGKIISEHELWTDVGFIENDTYFLYLGTRGKYINSKGETIEKE